MERPILGIDGSTPALSLAIVQGERVLARRQGRPGEDHAALLPAVYEELFAAAGVRAATLGGVVVGLGPGAFTGLRVALASAKALAYAAGLPLAGVSSLEAMAWAAWRRLPPGSRILPLLDARKQEVYAGFFRGGPERPEGLGTPVELVAPPEQVVERMEGEGGAILLFGPGYHAHRERFDAAGVERLPLPEGLVETPLAEEIAWLGAPRLGSFDKASLFAMEPRYLRGSGAERARQARSG